MKANPAFDAAHFQARIRFAELAAKRGDVQATCPTLVRGWRAV